MNQLDLLSESETQELVLAYLGRESTVKVLNVDVRPLDGPRAGFMSDHLRIKITVQEGESSPRKLCFFAKSLPRVVIHKEYVESTRFYIKETAFFKHLLKDMRAAQMDGGEDRWVPASYLVRDDLIVQEDLSLKDYKPIGSREHMDVEMCEAVLSELARFHVASIVLEERNRKTGETRSLKELYPVILEERSGSTLKSDGQRGWYQAGVRCLIKLVDHLQKYNESAEKLKVIKSKLPEICQLMNTIVNTSTKYRNVVCHADIWASNILIRYSEEKKPLSVRFVDFQIVRYAPPASDLVTLLYMLTDKDFRTRHRKHLLSYYYQEFADELRRSQIDSDKLIPLSQFEESCEFFNVLGMVISSVALPMVLLPLEFVDNFFKTPEKFVQFMLVDRSAQIVEYFHSDPEYRQRITNVLEELIDLCILVN